MVLLLAITHLIEQLAELLKAATMRPHGRAKVFRDCARFGFLNAKMANLPLFHLFWVSFHFLCWFLGHLVCAKLLNGNFGRAKKFAFRRSGSWVPSKDPIFLVYQTRLSSTMTAPFLIIHISILWWVMLQLKCSHTMWLLRSALAPLRTFILCAMAPSNLVTHRLNSPVDSPAQGSAIVQSTGG